MNKKDLINSFESLTPSDYQKQKMLNNVLSSGMEKTVHKVSFNFRYAFSTAAAAMCVLAVVVAVGPMYKYHKSSQNPSQKVIITDVADDTTEVQPVVEDTVSTDEALPNVAAEDKSADEQKVFTTAEAIPEQESAVAAEEPLAEDATPFANGRMLVTDDAVKAYTPQLNINHEEATNAVAKSGGYSSAVITIEEYYKLVGVYFESMFDIPDGFSDVTSKNGSADEWTFKYENGSSYIHINTTSNADYALQKLNGGYIPTDINGKKAVVFENGKSYKAYIISNNIAYTIDTYDVSEEDLANLLLSIAG